MDMVRLRNKPSYNGFDLSTKRNFTMKGGQLTPFWWQFVTPGDKVYLDQSEFTRTAPVNSAAFMRSRHYFDFYFVPFEYIWNKSDNVMVRMNNNVQHATNLTGKLPVTDGSFPCVDLETIGSYINRTAAFTNVGGGFNPSKDYFGFNRAANTVRLLEYLGYGDFSSYLTSSDSPFVENVKVNLFPLAAYHLCYNHYYRHTQWERSNPSSYNFDYITGNGDTDISSLVDELMLGSGTASVKNVGYNLFDLHYANLQKDLFHGTLPNPQYGSTSAIPLNFEVPLDNMPYSFNYDTGGAIPVAGSNVQMATDAPQGSGSAGLRISTNSQPALSSLSLGSASVTGSLSVLMLRQYEALQRWKEVSQSVDEDYKSQVEAHWGVSVSDYLAHKPKYLGSVTANLDINEVVNSNLAAGIEGNGAFIRGKGISSSDGKIKFVNQDRYGVVIGISYVLPIVDYITSGVDGKLLITDASGFPIPEFDSVGMETLSSVQFENNKDALGVSSPFNMGYVPRYVNWKTDYDRSYGAFRSSLKSWILAYESSGFVDVNHDASLQSPNDSLMVSYASFKVNPSLFDNVFLIQADDTYDTDIFWVTTFIDCKISRKLDYNGLPY